MILEAIVHGEPAPQGSKNAFVKGGRVVVVESSSKVKPWRSAVAMTVRQAAMKANWNADDHAAIRVELVFTMPAPKSLPKGHIIHTKRPDLDKLVRSTLDGITDAGNTWMDDSQVAAIEASKVYPGHPQALTEAGVTIRIARLT